MLGVAHRSFFTAGRLPGVPLALTLSGNETTDAVRAAALSGDGLSPEGSMGVWEATTNLVSNGGFETNTTGVTQVSSTCTRVTSEQKFGAASCRVVTGNAAANEGFYETFTATVAVYTVSAWVKGASGTVRMAVRDNSGANAQTGTAATMDGTWQRITLTTTNLTSATWRAYVETDSQQNITYYVDGLQAELQPLATPYVETDGGTGSRSAAIVTVPVTVVDETQMWIATRVRMGWPSTLALHGGGTQPTFFNWQDDGTHLLQMTESTSPDVRVARGAGSVGTAAAQTPSYVRGDVITVVGAFTATTHMISYNGAAFTSVANTGIPTLAATSFYIGNRADLARAIDGDLFWVACGTGTLTDADAAALHANGNSDPSPGLFPSTAQLKMIWKGTDGTARTY